jgi:uncharacterized membrane protein
MSDRPTGLGPVQLVIIAFDGGEFDRGILAELRSLREHDAVRLLDLLFVAKGEDGELAEAEESDLFSGEAADYGALVSALVGFGADGDVGAGDGTRATALAASRNGSLLDPEDAWFLADQIPAGTAAVVVLLEHRWAVPLRDAIEAAAGHDLVDAWVHPEDLAAIGAGRR